jgi:hypothetical protein
MGANNQNSTPTPPPWPKFLATSMLTIRAMMILTGGMKYRMSHQPGRCG